MNNVPSILTDVTIGKNNKFLPFLDDSCSCPQTKYLALRLKTYGPEWNFLQILSVSSQSKFWQHLSE